MDLKEQNWKNFCANHLRDWHGIWTRYTPQKEVKESFRSLRSFQSNSQQTEIAQTNRYIYADGTTQEQSWQYNQEFHSLADGHFHPAREVMRGLYLPQGAAAWITKQLDKYAYFGIELFLRYDDLRTSVGIVYDDTGTLARTASIREDSTGFPSQYWSTELALLPERNLDGNWQGNSVTITADLQVSPPISAHLNWSLEGHEAFFFPDGISLSCPSKIGIGSDFAIVANWLITDSKAQQVTAKYDKQGAFFSLTLEQFDRTA
ncbi:DUF3598 family protein [Lyngbya aestuarii]|uniref:DUF3598 family protein n=1 Tax=Lyngbya aestuarii TaxID=118322 RepID=UPI00403E1F28